MYSRRDFGRIALAGAPLSIALAAKLDSRVNGVRLGTSTYSFRDLPRTPGADNVDAIIQVLTDLRIGEIELFAPNVEPAGAGRGRAGAAPGGPLGAPGGAPAAGRGGRAASPEAIKAREDLRHWRLSTPVDHFQAIRKKFDTAGVSVFTYTINYRDDYTDDEIDKTFEQAKGLGVKVIASSTQLAMAKRLVPFAEKHKIVVALHGHANVTDPNEFATPESFQKGMDLSKYFKVNLDIGHFFAGGFDPVAYIQEHHGRITHLHMKDRRKDGGPNMPWGEGDTPIKQVLVLLKTKKYPIPAFVEYEYQGTGTSVEETRKCMDYMRKALA